jgi:hypothetical protein
VNLLAVVDELPHLEVALDAYAIDPRPVRGERSLERGPTRFQPNPGLRLPPELSAPQSRHVETSSIPKLTGESDAEYPGSVGKQQHGAAESATEIGWGAGDQSSGGHLSPLLHPAGRASFARSRDGDALKVPVRVDPEELPVESPTKRPDSERNVRLDCDRLDVLPLRQEFEAKLDSDEGGIVGYAGEHQVVGCPARSELSDCCPS